MSGPLDLMAEQGWNIGNAASTGKKKITILLKRYRDPLTRVGYLCPFRVRQIMKVGSCQFENRNLGR